MKAKTAKTPAAMDELLRAGQMMSNWFYNMAQTDLFSGNQKAAMNDMVKAWDAARKAVAKPSK